MFKGKKPIRKKREIPQELECYYCKLKTEPDYKDILKIRRFITDRGKLISKSRNGNCSKHQRKLTIEVKKARYLSFIPYTERHAL